MQFSTLGSSKIKVFENSFFDIVITLNDHPRYVKHVLGRISVFFALFGYWVRVQTGLVHKPAYAVFQPIQLKTRSFRNLFFFDIVIT